MVERATETLGVRRNDYCKQVEALELNRVIRGYRQVWQRFVCADCGREYQACKCKVYQTSIPKGRHDHAVRADQHHRPVFRLRNEKKTRRIDVPGPAKTIHESFNDRVGRGPGHVLRGNDP